MSYRRKKRAPSGRIKDDSRQMTLSGMNADTQSEEVLLSTAELFSGQPYQRPVRDCDVTELVREWDPRLLTPLVVSYRDGRYNLVDGQHRVCAMRRKNGGKDVTALCRVYHGLTYEQEAELYYKLDKAKGHLRLSHSTKALVESGSNAEVLEIKRLLEEAGFIWALDKPTKVPFEIEATRAVISAYRLLGGAAFSRMLELLAEVWHGRGTHLYYCYICRTHASNPSSCPKKNLHETELVEILWDTLQREILLAGDLDKLVRRYSRSAKSISQETGIQREVTAAKQALSRAKMLYDSLYPNYAAKLMSEQEYTEMKRQYRADMECAQARLDALEQRQKEARRQTIDNPWLTTCSRFKEEQALTEDMAHALIERVEIDAKNHVEITLRYRDEYNALLRLLAAEGEVVSQ